MLQRPKNEEELQKREAIGVIRASRFVRKYAHGRQAITLGTICEIHKCIFKKAWQEIAGEWRNENLKITDSKHLPPHHSEIARRMQKAGEDLIIRLKALKSSEAIWIQDNEVLNDEQAREVEVVVETAAWIHHIITYIHPFRDGNGRTARLAANLILERYGLVGISIKVERENKNRYRQALVQVDDFEDYEPLKELIFEGLIERYNGAAMKYLKQQR